MEPTCCAGIDPSQPLEGLLLFGTGLTVSLGHCVGMCGPIVTAHGLAQRGSGLAAPIALYHLGRVGSYVTIGAVLGLAGSATNLLPFARAGQGALSLGVGILMAVLAAGLLGLVPGSLLPRFTARVAAALRPLLASRSRRHQLGLGFLNGLLPCGPVFLVAMAAATAGSALHGGLSLFLYGLGTVPALVALGAGARAFSPAVRTRLVRVGTGMLGLLAIQLVLRGLATLEIVPHRMLGPVALW